MSDTWMADSTTPAKASDKLEVGTEIGGYRIAELIGQGGMGTVYLADSVAGDGRFALKVLAPELARSDEFRTRFLREARYASSIEHPNVVRVRDCGEADGMLYMAMDYVDGEDLRSLTADGPLEVDRAVSILGQIAGALDAVHATGVRHRDVKPGNVIVGREPDGYERSYLTDFGLSRNPVQDSRALTAAGTFVGTYYYAAPEQILGKDFDHRVDVYSLACLLFESLTGQPPFNHARGDEVLHAHVEEPPPSVSDRRGDLSPGIDSVVARGMAKDPDERYGSCTGLIAAARTALARAQAPAAAVGNPSGADTPAAPAPSPVRLRVTEGNARGTEIEVEDEFLIGRQADGAGTLGDDIEISRRHARIRRVPPHGCVIEDLGSTNGTFVNERRITGPEPLSVGDRVRVGETTLVVQFSTDPTPTSSESPVVSPPAVEPLPQAVEPPPVETPPPPTEASRSEPASPPLALQLEISAETGEARIHFDEDSEPVRLVYQDGRWRLAPPTG
jgi:pSer/pThr/pTyr-binding forkhead associated (FHA) protein/predicted Ser/Thr protein kinase